MKRAFFWIELTVRAHAIDLLIFNRKGMAVAAHSFMSWVEALAWVDRLEVNRDRAFPQGVEIEIRVRAAK